MTEVNFWPPVEGKSMQRVGYIRKTVRVHGVDVAELRRYSDETLWFALNMKDLLHDESDGERPPSFASGSLEEMKKACIDRYSGLSEEEARSVWR